MNPETTMPTATPAATPTADAFLRGRRHLGARVHLHSPEQEAASLPKRRQSTITPWRRRRITKWLRPLALAALGVGGPAVAFLWLATSPRFALAEIAITAGERVPEVWVRETLEPFEARNLPLLPLAEVTRKLESHPWLEAVGLRKELPNRLSVSVIERRAEALLSLDAELFYLDRDGRVIAPLDAGTEGENDLAVVSLTRPDMASGPRVALELLRELETAAPVWLDGLQRVEVLGAEDFKVHTAGLPCPLLLRAGTVEVTTRRLEELLPEIVARYDSLGAIDLRFERRIIVQPSVSGEVAIEGSTGARDVQS